MKNFNEDRLKITGHLQIAKLYKNGEEDIVFDDHNVITSGLGVGLAIMQGELTSVGINGSHTILDYQLDRVQLGVSANSDESVLVAGHNASAFQLSGPLSSVAEYGADSKLFISTDYHWKFDTAVAPPVAADQTGAAPFALIPHSKVTKINESSVRYTIIFDEDACNNLTRAPGGAAALNEIGLYMKNPIGFSAYDASVLCAYRKFSDIIKTSDFSLIFRWTINF
jgi:hypothetical protein